MGLNHRQPALVERNQTVEAHLEGRHEEEHQAAGRSVAHVAPEARVAEQKAELDAAIDFGAGGIHDEQYGPEELAALHQSEGKEEDVAHHRVELEAEDALLQNQ